MKLPLNIDILITTRISKNENILIMRFIIGREN